MLTEYARRIGPNIAGKFVQTLSDGKNELLECSKILGAFSSLIQKFY